MKKDPFKVPVKSMQGFNIAPVTGNEDMINHPNHYTAGKYEVIDYIQDKLTPEQFEGYCIGNNIKYVSRYRYKGGIEDLKKANWYLNRLIESEETPNGKN